MAQNLKISVAQISSVKGNVAANIHMHLDAVRTAADLGVAYIVFPELSLTGYEPQLSAKLAFSKIDPRLAPLTAAARDHQIHMAVGAPLKTSGHPTIGEIVIAPDGNIDTYAKMNLHPGEEHYFSSGQDHHCVHLEELKLFNAICADTNNTGHVEACVGLGASVYIAGVLISAEGYASDTRKLKAYAAKFGLLVGMANHHQPTGGWVPTGKSAFWGPDGLIAAAGHTGNALVVAERTPSGWAGAAIDI